MIGLNTTYPSNSINYVTTTFFHKLDSCIYSTGILFAFNKNFFYFRSTSDLVILLW